MTSVSPPMPTSPGWRLAMPDVPALPVLPDVPALPALPDAPPLPPPPVPPPPPPEPHPALAIQTTFTTRTGNRVIA
jgi:hypothetical protein